MSLFKTFLWTWRGMRDDFNWWWVIVWYVIAAILVNFAGIPIRWFSFAVSLPLAIVFIGLPISIWIEDKKNK